MRVSAVALSALLLLAAAAPLCAARQIIGSEQDHSLASQSEDCQHFYKTTFTRFPEQVQNQEQREISLAGITPLRIVARDEGGVSVRGWAQPYAKLIACRYAVANTREQAQSVLDGIRVSHAGGTVSASGPAATPSQAWWTNMILYVPQRAAVDIRATSGGVAVRNMKGSVDASATTGGISVAQSSGSYRIRTSSGGITLEHVTGKVEASTQDGAIALRIPATAPPTLEARTGSSEILCTLPGCEGVVQWSDNRRLLRLGGGTPDIRLTTTAAPIWIGPVTF